MAKLTAPLLSFGARGKLADTLVYFPWKGIAAVRSYVIPSNPNSSSQQTQRGYFSTAVGLWHSLLYNADDRSAWNRAASVLGSPMSGFNAFVRFIIDTLVAGNTFKSITAVSVDDNGGGSFDVSAVTQDAAQNCEVHWGYAPSSLINIEGPDAATANLYQSGNMAAAPFSTVYFKVITNDGSDQGETGIYRFALGA